MAAGKMLNFRARPPLQALIDDAAARRGMDRSTWLRTISEEAALADLSGPQIRLGDDTAAKNGKVPEPKPFEAPACKGKEPEAHPKTSVNFIPGVGLRICTLCGDRFK